MKSIQPVVEQISRFGDMGRELEERINAMDRMLKRDSNGAKTAASTEPTANFQHDTDPCFRSTAERNVYSL